MFQQPLESYTAGKYLSYFTQTQQWADFWREANGAGHQVHTIQIAEQTTYVYEYPWFFGQTFLYIPSAPVLPAHLSTLKSSVTNPETVRYVRSFLTKVNALAHSTGATHIKLDLDYQISQSLALGSKEEALSFLCHNNDSLSSITIARKRIMYSATSILDCSMLTFDTTAATNIEGGLKEFFEVNTGFWSKVNSGHRAKTRKSLVQNWDWSEEKSSQNFEHFWSIYFLTSTRQNFSTQPKSYFGKLYSKPQSRIIILFDPAGNPQAAWFGYCCDNSIIYLYGGNTDYSMQHFGQYFIHLIALKMCTQENKKSYDLGGYDPHAGYGVFKERYKGKIVDFFGPFDIIVKPHHYRLIGLMVRVRKLIMKMK